jgi:phosphoglucosamine mutase
MAGLRLLEAMVHADRPLSELSERVHLFPQVLINVEVREKQSLDEVPQIVSAIREAERQLGQEGRVLVRYSGTEQKCRVMVEGPDREETRRICEQIAGTVRECLG